MAKNLLVLLILTSSLLYSTNRIEVGQGETTIDLINNDDYSMSITYNIAELHTDWISTERGDFSSISISGYTYSTEIGKPKLPVLRKIISVPLNAYVSTEILESEQQELDLSDFEINNRIFPAQPSVSKSADPEEIEFVFDESFYQVDRFSEENIIRVDELGILRGLRLFLITFSPCRYNPVQNRLEITNNLKLNVDFNNPDLNATQELRSKTFSPAFEGIYKEMVFNYRPSEMRDQITSYPIKYIIISDPMFETQLQPFIQWKTEMGYEMIVAYTNEIGSNSSAIKTYIETLYDAATPDDPAPSYILFVGDTAQIPAWSGDTGGHITDLDYVLLDGNDYMPEIYYGRFSANNLEELQPQIDKTLEYEKLDMPDPSYLGEVVMIAGMDSWHGDTWGNGQINYGTTYYFNEEHGIYSYTYLYPESGSNSYNIIQNVSEGVGYINYTAHGGPTSWSDPSFTISDINSLENEHEYCLAVGNCCLTNKFEEYTCFGEAWLRAENKGAIGYIGGTNSTYWDEDYWWGVGATGSITANPTYEESGLGVYDGLFHDHGEPFSEWYTTTGGMIFRGNLAVIEGNGSANYYWEIYAIMGDPSLIPYLGIPAENSVSYPQTIFLGLGEAQINAEPYSYVGLSMNGQLYAAGLVDESGTLNLEFEPFQTPGTALLIVTAQNKEPFYADIEVIPNEGPYVILNNFAINDDNNNLPEYDETVSLDITLENVGIEPANGLSATLSSDDTYVNIITPTIYVGDIAAGENLLIENAYEIEIADDVPDQYRVYFVIQIEGSESWSSQFNFVVNAPEFQIGNFSVSDPSGNNNGILDPGETAIVSIETYNIGHAASPEATAYLSCLDEGITIENTEYFLSNIDAETIAYAEFTLTADEDMDIGTPILLTYDVEAGNYGITGDINLTVGLCVEDFESGDFSNFDWQLFGDANWIVTNNAYEGDYCAKSGDISDGQITSLKIQMYVLVDGQISFWSKVSSESGYDFLYFYIDGSETQSWSGEMDWALQTFDVTAGEHTFKWEYDKDGSVSDGEDCGWVDFIIFPPNASGATGFIDGTITSIPPADYENAQITAGEYFTNADESGYYILEVPYGTYDVTASLQGYETVTVQYVEVEPYQTVTVDFELLFIAPPINLEAELIDSTVNLSWESPETRSLQSNQTKQKAKNKIEESKDLQYYKIYRNLNDGDFSMIYATTQTQYSDELTLGGNYGYYVTGVYTFNSESEPSDTVYVEYATEVHGNDLPVVTKLIGNYPNPFNPTTTISFSLKESDNIRIDIYNLKGQRIITLLDDMLETGYHSVEWTGKDNTGNEVDSGIFFYKMKSSRYTSIKKMILLK